MEQQQLIFKLKQMDVNTLIISILCSTPWYAYETGKSIRPELTKFIIQCQHHKASKRETLTSDGLWAYTHTLSVLTAILPGEPG